MRPFLLGLLIGLALLLVACTIPGAPAPVATSAVPPTATPPALVVAPTVVRVFPTPTELPPTAEPPHIALTVAATPAPVATATSAPTATATAAPASPTSVPVPTKAPTAIPPSPTLAAPTGPAIPIESLPLYPFYPGSRTIATATGSNVVTSYSSPQPLDVMAAWMFDAWQRFGLRFVCSYVSPSGIGTSFFWTDAVGHAYSYYFGLPSNGQTLVGKAVGSEGGLRAYCR